MRAIGIVAVAALELTAVAGVYADKTKTITVPEVEVRSGPSTTFYPTSKLHRGDVVKVVREENGWLAIEPPVGSFSWINTLFLARTPTAPGFIDVKGDEVPVRVGSSISNAEPTTQRVTLKRGTIVKVLDPHGAATKDGNWVPIEPPAQECRYIPADAVKPLPQEQTVNASPGSGPTGIQAPAAALAAAHSAADQQLLSQAEAAERKGNIAEARRLYQQLARLTTDHELSVKCINRDHYLAEGHTGSVPPGYQPGVPSTSTYPPQAGTMPPGYPAAQPIAPRPATSVYTYVPAMPGSRPTQAFTASYIRPPQQPNAAVTQWSPPGQLRKAPFLVDGKPAYALDTEKGEPMMYLTAKPGVNLDSYLGKRVELLGQMTYRPEMYHKNFMAVEHVRERP